MEYVLCVRRAIDLPEADIRTKLNFVDPLTNFSNRSLVGLSNARTSLVGELSIERVGDVLLRLMSALEIGDALRGDGGGANFDAGVDTGDSGNVHGELMVPPETIEYSDVVKNGEVIELCDRLLATCCIGITPPFDAFEAFEPLRV